MGKWPLNLSGFGEPQSVLGFVGWVSRPEHRRSGLETQPTDSIHDRTYLNAIGAGVLRAVVVLLCAGGVRAGDEPARTLKDIPLSELRTTLKGYPGDWRVDTDLHRGLPEPPRRKPVAADAVVIDLPRPDTMAIDDIALSSALKNRRSRRHYAAEPLSVGELGFLLWSAQGVTSSTTVDGEREARPLRTAPSAGGRYPLETYVVALRVDSVPPGIYRYLPNSHQLLTVRADPELKARLLKACYNQPFIGEAAAVLVWSAIPERTEWKYGYISHRMIAMEAGHACQNLYLACEAVGAGACALLSYDQAKVDALIGIDGANEFALYMATVGKVKK